MEMVPADPSPNSSSSSSNSDKSWDKKSFTSIGLPESGQEIEDSYPVFQEPLETEETLAMVLKAIVRDMESGALTARSRGLQRLVEALDSAVKPISLKGTGFLFGALKRLIMHCNDVIEFNPMIDAIIQLVNAIGPPIQKKDIILDIIAALNRFSPPQILLALESWKNVSGNSAMLVRVVQALHATDPVKKLNDGSKHTLLSWVSRSFGSFKDEELPDLINVIAAGLQADLQGAELLLSSLVKLCGFSKVHNIAMKHQNKSQMISWLRSFQETSKEELERLKPALVTPEEIQDKNMPMEGIIRHLRELNADHKRGFMARQIVSEWEKLPGAQKIDSRLLEALAAKYELFEYKGHKAKAITGKFSAEVKHILRTMNELRLKNPRSDDVATNEELARLTHRFNLALQVVNEWEEEPRLKFYPALLQRYVCTNARAHPQKQEALIDELFPENEAETLKYMLHFK